MKWFIAKLTFQILSDEAAISSEFDEQLRLINARNYEEAFLKSRMIGVREEDTIINDSMNNVSWKFIDVSDLTLLDEFKDGMELHSRIFEVEHARDYISYLHHKADDILLSMPGVAPKEEHVVYS